MKALVLNEFGRSNFSIQDVPLPCISDDEVLIKVEYAGIGEWDQFEIDGGYHKMLGIEHNFPYICGSEGSGVIQDKGANVTNLNVGDWVYACSFLNTKGGFFAEYIAVHQDFVKSIPKNLSYKSASAILGVGTVALRGIQKLDLSKDDNIIIHGASGGVGHLAIQFAKCTTNNVIGIASGEDGISLCKSYGINSINGKTRLKTLNFSIYNKMLLTTSLDEYVQHVLNMKQPATIAYPVGRYSVPEINSNSIKIIPYYGELDKEIINQCDNYIQKYNLKCSISNIFSIHDYVDAYNQLHEHYTGKLIFKMDFYNVS